MSSIYKAVILMINQNEMLEAQEDQAAEMEESKYALMSAME